MTPFASIALIRRDGAIVFKPPRKENPTTATQARKTANRYWRASVTGDDKLMKVIVVREIGGKLEISERAHNSGIDKPWLQYEAEIAASSGESHIAACLAELGIDVASAPRAMPDVIEINGRTYRRDI